MAVTVQVRSKAARQIPEQSDNYSWGTQATLYMQDCESEINASSLLTRTENHTYSLGSVAQVTAGTADYSDFATALAALSAGDKLIVRNFTWAPVATVDITKGIAIHFENTTVQENGIAAANIITVSADDVVFSGVLNIKQSAGTPTNGIEITGADFVNAGVIKISGAFTGAKWVKVATSTMGYITSLAAATMTLDVSVLSITDAAVTNDLTVGNDVTVTGDISCDNITTTTDATIGGDANVTGDVDCDNLTTTTDVTVGGDLAVTGDVAITGALEF